METKTKSVSISDEMAALKKESDAALEWAETVAVKAYGRKLTKEEMGAFVSGMAQGWGCCRRFYQENGLDIPK